MSIIGWGKVLEFDSDVFLKMIKEEPDGEKRDGMCFLLGIPVPGAENDTLVGDSSDLQLTYVNAFHGLEMESFVNKRLKREAEKENRKDMQTRCKYADALQIFMKDANTNMAIVLMQIHYSNPGAVLYKDGDKSKLLFDYPLLNAAKGAARNMRMATVESTYWMDDGAPSEEEDVDLFSPDRADSREAADFHF